MPTRNPLFAGNGDFGLPSNSGPTPSPKPQCLGEKKDGTACNAPPSEDGYCPMHGPRAEEIRAKARQASNEARKNKVEQREQASEDAKLSLTQRIRRAAAASQDALVDSLVKAAVADGNGAAMRELLNRVEGKVTDSLNVNAGDPFSMSEADLHRWLTESPTEAESTA